MSPPTPFDTEELLAQMGWVRALARQAGVDAHTAEDLTQDTMLVALRGTHPPVAAGDRRASLRRWLAAVVRNLGRTARRGARRRAVREAAVGADREPQPATVELIERAATQRELVGSLLELPEPYRSTLLLRFFEECSQREIAARTGVPVSTVGTRIAEGLRRLRHKCRGRGMRLAPLLTSLPRPRDAASPAWDPGIVIMSIQTKLIVVGLALIAALIGLLSLGPAAPDVAGPREEAEAPPGSSAIATAPRGMPRQVVAGEAQPQAEATPAGFRDIPEHAGIVVALVRGRVIDTAGMPVGGVEVQRIMPRGMFEPTGREAQDHRRDSVTADATGRFQAEGATPFVLRVHDEEYATVYEGTVMGTPDAEVLVVVARRIPLAGVVVDEHGTPIPDVRVTVQASISRAGLDLSASNRLAPETHTDARGAFTLADAAAVDGARIVFRAPGFAIHDRGVPSGGDGAMLVVLSRELDSVHTIGGRVVGEDGSPVAGAYVSTGVMAVRTDERGFFVIDFAPWLIRVDPAAPTVLTAISPGHAPVARTLPSLAQSRASGWPEDIVLRLAGRPLTIRGTVVDEHGEPLAGVLVEPADMTEFGIVPAEGRPGFFGVPKTQEQLAGGGETHTDADGRFELKGLLDRDYAICALLERSLLCVVSGPVAAGEQNARIVLDRRGLGTIAGRIVDRHGRGIPGVRVAVSRRRPGELAIGRSATTDEDGGFRITGVTTKPAFLRIEGDPIVPELFRELDPADAPAHLELPVGRRRRVQIDWTGWPGAGDELVVVDAGGEVLTMMRLAGASMRVVPSVAFRAGATEVLVVSDAAVDALVRRDGEEVKRIRLDLLPDQLSLIRIAD